MNIVIYRQTFFNKYITLFYLTGRAELTFKFTGEHSIS